MTGPPLLRPVIPRRADTVVEVDGERIPAQLGESLLTALLAAGVMTGHNEFDGNPRCGFCLMGVCQDCTLWYASGTKLTACTTVVHAGMVLRRQAPLGDEP